MWWRCVLGNGQSHCREPGRFTIFITTPRNSIGWVRPPCILFLPIGVTVLILSSLRTHILALYRRKLRPGRVWVLRAKKPFEVFEPKGPKRKKGRGLSASFYRLCQLPGRDSRRLDFWTFYHPELFEEFCDSAWFSPEGRTFCGTFDKASESAVCSEWTGGSGS